MFSICSPFLKKWLNREKNRHPKDKHENLHVSDDITKGRSYCLSFLIAYSPYLQVFKSNFSIKVLHFYSLSLHQCVWAIWGNKEWISRIFGNIKTVHDQCRLIFIIKDLEQLSIEMTFKHCWITCCGCQKWYRQTCNDPVDPTLHAPAAPPTPLPCQHNRGSYKLRLHAEAPFWGEFVQKLNEMEAFKLVNEQFGRQSQLGDCLSQILV